jgi:hypothetical protein
MAALKVPQLTLNSKIDFIATTIDAFISMPLPLRKFPGSFASLNFRGSVASLGKLRFPPGRKFLGSVASLKKIFVEGPFWAF